MLWQGCCLQAPSTSQDTVGDPNPYHVTDSPTVPSHPTQPPRPPLVPSPNCHPHGSAATQMAENRQLCAAVSARARPMAVPPQPPAWPGAGWGSQGAILGDTAHPAHVAVGAPPFPPHPAPGGLAPALSRRWGPPALAGVQPSSDAEECGGAAGGVGLGQGGGGPPACTPYSSATILVIGLAPSRGVPVPSSHSQRSCLIAGSPTLRGGHLPKPPIAMGPAP